MPSDQLRPVCVSTDTQTDLGIMDRGLPVVNFLDGSDDSSDNVDIPGCFHLGTGAVFARSPRIPMVVEGVRVPMLLDTNHCEYFVCTTFVSGETTPRPRARSVSPFSSGYPYSPWGTYRVDHRNMWFNFKPPSILL